MEKVFWGMVGGCTVAFVILLTMYLNKSGVIDLSPEPATEEASVVEEETAEEETTVDRGSEIDALVESAQTNYATAMQVFDEASEAIEHEETEEASGQNNDTGNGIRTNGTVDPDRNGEHGYFLEDPEALESSAEEESTEETPASKSDSEYQYDLYADHVVIKKYLGTKADLIIPDTIEGQPVTELAASSFASSKYLVRVDIPDSVTTMGDNVFKSSTLLVAVTMPKNLVTLGTGAFDSCEALVQVTIPDGVTEIKDKTFNECAELTKVTLSGDITKIGKQAFYECAKLQLTKLPSGLTTIDDEAFYGCAALAVAKFPSTLTKIGVSAFEGCIKLPSAKLPGIETVESLAFSGCTGITELTFKSGTTVIADEAFSGCTGITTVSFPKTLVSIGENAFSGCTSLETVSIPKNTLSIKSGAFSGCIFTEVTINKVCSYQENSFPSEVTIENY